MHLYRSALLRFADDGTALYEEDGLLATAPDDRGVQRVHAAGAWRALAPLYFSQASQPVTHWPGRIIAPGFVDMHVHYPQLDVIGSPADGLLPWLENYTFPHESRFGDAAYAAEVARVRRRGGHLALVMIDLDDFKAFNDRYGHLAGDRALAHFVSVLQATMRPSDVLCRFGGEEFVMLLPDTTVAEACTAARRFLAAFSSRAIPELDQSMTFSAGVVGHDGSESLDDALERADVATYAAKRAGKNRVLAG